MQDANGRLNIYAQTLEDAQTRIRDIVKRAFLHRSPYAATNRALGGVINRAVSQGKITRLKADAQQSLWNFANRQRLIWEESALPPEIILILGQYAAKDFRPDKQTESRITREFRRFNAPVTDMGVPLHKYYKDVWDQKVKPTIDRLVESVALDPNDYSGRNSLRNLAEMETRYQAHLDRIEELKASGIKLVVCSSHADCSDRCAPWQGRVYSLDGTYGVVDGHRYVPLELATEIYYTTKAGRTYKNGLLGFNCRHELRPYEGQLLPTISAEERKAEYAVTLRQRAMERAVRRKRVEALMLKDINKTWYLEARKKAATLYANYMKFSKENERAFYPMRTAI
jgi:hypothetical protein